VSTPYTRLRRGHRCYIPPKSPLRTAKQIFQNTNEIIERVYIKERCMRRRVQLSSVVKFLEMLFPKMLLEPIFFYRYLPWTTDHGKFHYIAPLDRRELGTGMMNHVNQTQSSSQVLEGRSRDQHSFYLLYLLRCFPNIKCIESRESKIAKSEI
jgi:hypothetical protein